MMRGRISLGCLVAVLAPLLVLATCMMTDRHPSDSAMAESFERHRPEFEALLRMIREEPQLTGVAPGYILVAGKGNVPESERSAYINGARWTRYRALFDALGLEGGVERRADGSVTFLRSRAGLAIGGSTKSFRWSPRPPQGFLFADSAQSTETVCRGAEPDCTGTKQIADDWYIAFGPS